MSLGLSELKHNGLNTKKNLDNNYIKQLVYRYPRHGYNITYSSKITSINCNITLEDKVISFRIWQIFYKKISRCNNFIVIVLSVNSRQILYRSSLLDGAFLGVQNSLVSGDVLVAENKRKQILRIHPWKRNTQKCIPYYLNQWSLIISKV